MNLCDACGDRIAPDVAIERDGWTLYRRVAYRNGERICMRPQFACFLYMLAKNAGRTLSGELLGRRIASGDPDDLGDPRNLAVSIACRVRKILADPPFETVHREGYRWAA